MSSPDKVYEAVKTFIEKSEDLTELYGSDVGKVIYRALLSKERNDGIVGFGPNDLWNISNEELISLIQKAQEDVRVQAQSKSSN